MSSGWARLSASLMLLSASVSAAPVVSEPCASEEGNAGAQLENSGRFDESAAAYSTYARACTLAPDAPRALARAVELRVALDQPKETEADALFFRRHFAKGPSEELDRITFAQARRADEYGDFKTVISTLQDARVVPEHRLEREVMLLEARKQVGFPIADGQVRHLATEWHRTHRETVAGWAAMPINERRMLSSLGQLTIDVLCHGKDADLTLRHPTPGTMTTRQYVPILVHWVKRKMAAVDRHASCLESVALLKPVAPPLETAEALLRVATMYGDFKTEFEEIGQYKQMQVPPGPDDSPCNGFYGFVCHFNGRIEAALYGCVKRAMGEEYAGETQLRCERALNLKYHHGSGGEQFPVTEMVPPLRTPPNAVARPVPMDDPSAAP